VDVVFHCAVQIAISKKMEGGMLGANIEGTRNLVSLSLEAGVRRFVHFSSIHALKSDPEDEPIDETRALVDHDSFMLYDLSKAEGERIVGAAVAQGLDAVILNPTAVIGPFDFKPSLMGDFILLMFHRKLPALVAGGFNWVDVRDVVEGALVAEKKGRKGERYLLAGEWESVAGLARRIESLMGKKIGHKTIPHWLAHIGVPFLGTLAGLKRTRPLYTHDSLRTLTRHRFVSSQKAESELGYMHRSLAQTLRDTLAWFKEYGFIN
jgi:dihydroflavonol-4-reductase